MTAGRVTVTCIVIVHNGAEFLEDAIASVLGQTSPDWELVVADDGSTDGSREIARRHAAADGRVRLVAHPDRGNHGTGATRNLGLSASRGTFVGFLDADDVWEPTKVAEQVAILEQHPEVAMVYGRTLIWHSWAVPSAAEDHFYDLGVAPDRVHEPPVLFRNLLRNVYQTPTTCSALLRRAVVAEVGGFDESLAAMFEDQLFFAKVLLQYPVFVSDRCWSRYRQHAGSTSAASAAAGGDLAAQVGYLRRLRRYVRSQRRTPSVRRSVERGDQRAVERTLARLAVRRALVRLRGDARTGRRPW
jgi:glycosyltransferase involved in cell wall biosynthesis